MESNLCSLGGVYNYSALALTQSLSGIGTRSLNIIDYTDDLWYFESRREVITFEKEWKLIGPKGIGINTCVDAPEAVSGCARVGPKTTSGHLGGLGI